MLRYRLPGSIWRPSYRRGYEYRQVQARILIADPRQLIRAGLRKLLEADPAWRVVGEASRWP